MESNFILVMMALIKSVTFLKHCPLMLASEIIAPSEVSP